MPVASKNNAAIATVPSAITEAADLAASLITRSLRLLERTIAEQESSPTPPTLKDASATITAIKRAADTLKILARLQSAPTDRSTPTPPAPITPPAASTAILHTRPTALSAPSTIPTALMALSSDAPPKEVAAAIAGTHPEAILSFLDSLTGSLFDRVRPLLESATPESTRS